MASPAPFAITPKPTPEDERLSEAVDTLLSVGDRVGESLAKRGLEYGLMQELLSACARLREARLEAMRR